MEANEVNINATRRPKCLADMLPELTALMTENNLLSTSKKQPKNRSTMAVASTTQKKFMPLTLAEMYAVADIGAKRNPTRTAPGPQTASAMKRRWNTSVKVDKRISHTKDGQMKHNPVRKVLNFQSNPQPSTSNKRATMALTNPLTPKFPKPVGRAKKGLHHNIQAKNTVRISGVYKMPETPLETKPAVKSRIANKENNNPIAAPRQPTYNHVNRNILPSPRPVPKARKTIVPIPDTPMSNDSWKSSCDASFLQKEQDIHDIEEKANAIPEESVLSNLAEVSPPISTPFKEYRNVKEYFNNSSDMENSLNDTIKCFERPSTIEEGRESREESGIVSLCDMFNKATVTHSVQGKSELDILIQIKQESESNIKAQMKLLKSQTKLLHYVNRLIHKKRTGSKSPIALDETLTEGNLLPKITKINDKTPEKTFFRCSVIKSPAKSPSYKIPKKTPCLRKKVFHKSMPDMQTGMFTPKANIDSGNRAMAMYMKMKEQMKFLNTPVVKQRPVSSVPDTPALTSHNLQSQLDKLFNNS